MTSLKNSILLLSLTALIVPCKSHTTDGWGVPLLAGLGLAALTTALCYAYGETNESIVTKAEHVIPALFSYKPDLEAWATFHAITDPIMVNIHSLIESANELLELHPTAQKIIAAGTTMRAYISEIMRSIQTAQIHITKLEKRIYALERIRHRTSEESRTLQRMHRVLTDLQRITPYLRLYYDFFSAHLSYFDLYEYETKLYIIYQREFSCGNAYQYDPLALATSIKQCVGARYAHNAYPYIAYKKQLDTHIKELQHYMKNNTYRYKGRYAMAQQLEQFLIHIRGIIVGDSEFVREKDARAREREHRENQQLMQQQIAAQQQLAAAQQAQATAMMLQTVTPRVHVSYKV